MTPLPAFSHGQQQKDSPAFLKRCGHCREVKPVGAFYRHPSTSTGLQSWCVECARAKRLANRRRLPALQRFESKTVKDPSGCWEWRAFRNASGYGQFGVREDGKQRIVYAHRFAYEAYIGLIPDGLTVDHICRNRGCVNPTHMELVTAVENLRRGHAHRRAVSA